MRRPSKKAEYELRVALLAAIDNKDKDAQYILRRALTKLSSPLLWAALTKVPKR